MFTSWCRGMKSGTCESRLWLSGVLGSSAELQSKTALMAQSEAGRLVFVAGGGGCLRVRPLPYLIHIGRDLVRGLSLGEREEGVAGVVVVGGDGVGVGVIAEVAETVGVVIVGVRMVVGVVEVIVGEGVVVVEVIGVVEEGVVLAVVGVFKVAVVAVVVIWALLVRQRP